MSEATPYIKWHSIFAAMLRELLTPLQIQVLDEFTVTGEVDVILIQRLAGQGWTEEQRQYLPDGLRDSLAMHLLIEFKYTQSLDEGSFRQAIAYDLLYRQQKPQRDLPRAAIQTFMVSAKTPLAETLAQFEYQATPQAGVYVSQDKFLRHIPLILLNELGLEQYNAFFKLFASRSRIKLAAVETLQARGLLRQLHGKLFWLIKGLLNLWFKKGDEFMEAITAETLIEEGKRITEWLDPLWLDSLLTKEVILQLSSGQEVYYQGWEEGAEQEALALLLRTLPRLFGELKPELVAQLKHLTLPQLRQAVDLAFDINDIHDFEAQITAWLVVS